MHNTLNFFRKSISSIALSFIAFCIAYFSYIYFFLADTKASQLVFSVSEINPLLLDFLFLWGIPSLLLMPCLLFTIQWLRTSHDNKLLGYVLLAAQGLLFLFLYNISIVFTLTLGLSKHGGIH
ncbi:MAG: hypothetical protein AB7P76_10730 [Candidatus Melainabacteria bacterium]